MSIDGFMEIPQSYTISALSTCMSPDITSNSTSVTAAAYTKYCQYSPSGLLDGEYHPSTFKETSTVTFLSISIHSSVEDMSYTPFSQNWATRGFRVLQAFNAAWQTTSLVPDPPVTPPLAMADVDVAVTRIIFISL